MSVGNVTIYDIASKLHVSVSTVSRAIRGSSAISAHTKAKVLALAESMGYIQNMAASNLRQKKTGLVGLLVDGLKSRRQAAIIAGIEKITADAGYDLLLANTNAAPEKEAAIVKHLSTRRVDGVIASFIHTEPSTEHFKLLAEREMPLIMLGASCQSYEGMLVMVDKQKSTHLATMHLIRQQCKRIFLIADIGDENRMHQWQQGFEQALQTIHLALEQVTITGDAASVVAAVMAASPMPDGLVIIGRRLAQDCINDLQLRWLRVPEDIAIVAVEKESIMGLAADDISIVGCPAEKLGQIACRSLVNHLAGRFDIYKTSAIVVPAELLIAGSSDKKLVV